MKKTISISIASTPFIVEEDAYEILETYLKEIKKHFEETSEVVDDIEARIAEQLLESKKKIISTKEISSVLASMGAAQDFDEEVNSQTTKKKKITEPLPKKSLYRSSQNKIIGGVAAGIAAYLGVEIVWVRFAFVLVSLINGFGVLIYLALWLSMPEAKTASQLLEMSGTPVTLETLSERVKERVDEVKKDTGLFQRIVYALIALAGGILTFIVTKFFPVVIKFIGTIISFFMIIALLALSILLGYVSLNSGTLMDPALYALVPTAAIIPFIFSVYFTAIVPILFVLLLGIALIKNKATIRGTTALKLLGVWFTALLILGIIAVSYGPKMAEYVDTAPEYQQTSEAVPSLSSFTVIEAKNMAHVKYIQGATTSVIVTGEKRDLSNISITSENGTLTIASALRNKKITCIFCDNKIPKVIVTAPTINIFDGENSTHIETEMFSASSGVAINLSNGSEGMFKIKEGDITSKLENGVILELSGKATSVTLQGFNGVKIDASKLKAEKADVSVENGGKVEIGETKILKARARNAATIIYSGTPTLTKEVENQGSVEPAIRED